MVDDRQLRLAYFSPLPPARSGIADYSAALLQGLDRRFNLTLYTPDPDVVSPSLHQTYIVRPAAAFPGERWTHDTALYHMGNNTTHHEEMYQMARRYPGVLVLHDYGLHHFIAHRTVGRGDYAGYVREMGYSLGLNGVYKAWAIRHGRMAHPVTEVPLNARLVDLSLGVLVHSRYSQQLLIRDHPGRPIHVVPSLNYPNDGQSRRPELPWPDEAIIFASFGQITGAKRLEDALRAFARLRRTVPHARYLIVGEEQGDVDLEALLSELELEEVVVCTGYVEEVEEFVGWIKSADVVVNLRYPTVGETSAAALRGLSAGRPIIVYDHGWYSELPDEVALKVRPLDQDALLAAMHRLAEHPEERQRRGKRGKAYAAQEHDPDRAAEAYVKAITQILDRVTGASIYA